MSSFGSGIDAKPSKIRRIGLTVSAYTSLANDTIPQHSNMQLSNLKPRQETLP
jgi:hypothetical protein